MPIPPVNLVSCLNCEKKRVKTPEPVSGKRMSTSESDSTSTLGNTSNSLSSSLYSHSGLFFEKVRGNVSQDMSKHLHPPI